jgi:hypothetical protein
LKQHRKKKKKKRRRRRRKMKKRRRRVGRCCRQSVTDVANKLRPAATSSLNSKPES